MRAKKCDNCYNDDDYEIAKSGVVVKFFFVCVVSLLSRVVGALAA